MRTAVQRLGRLRATSAATNNTFGRASRTFATTAPKDDGFTLTPPPSAIPPPDPIDPSSLVPTVDNSMGVWNLVQASIEATHQFAGTPWWATFVGCTLALRMSMIPLSLYQVKNTFNMTSGVAGAQTKFLTGIFHESYSRCATGKERKHTIAMYVTGLRKIWKVNKIHPMKSFIVPIVQIPIVVTYMLAARDMIHNGGIDLSNGGTLWFPDLAAADPTLVLPCTAAALTYTSLERSFGRSDKPTVMQYIREVFQMGIILTFPFIAHLPAGVFMYWIPSTTFILAQTSILRAEGTRKLLGMEAGPVAPEDVFPSTAIKPMEGLKKKPSPTWGIQRKGGSLKHRKRDPHLTDNNR